MNIILRDCSEVYEQFRYPGGESQVRLKPESAAEVKAATSISITARIRRPDDLIHLALLRDAIDGTGTRATVHLRLPYLPYSRADRRFTDGDCDGLAVFGRLINAMNFASVTTMDAHNANAARLRINRLCDESSMPLVNSAIVDFARRNNSKWVTVLYPDAGARTRYELPDEIGCNIESIGLNKFHCEKKRNAATGQFEGFKVPDVPLGQPAIIIDDICDGGGTFLGIAGLVGGIHLGLFVTHGIFSKGVECLQAHFSAIYTTDSIDRPSDDGLIILR